MIGFGSQSHISHQTLKNPRRTPDPNPELAREVRDASTNPRERREGHLPPNPFEQPPQPPNATEGDTP